MKTNKKNMMLNLHQYALEFTGWKDCLSSLLCVVYQLCHHHTRNTMHTVRQYVVIQIKRRTVCLVMCQKNMNWFSAFLWRHTDYGVLEFNRTNNRSCQQLFLLKKTMQLGVSRKMTPRVFVYPLLACWRLACLFEYIDARLLDDGSQKLEKTANQALDG